MNQHQAPARRDVKGLLARVDEARDQLTTYLPEGVKPERFMALARRAIAEQPQLAECSTTSVLQALSRCASSGLPLDGQFSSLIVRKSRRGPPTATWDPTYRGMISMALSSGYVNDVQCFAVTEHDEFSVEQGTEPRIRHVPALLRGGRIVAAYAWARLRSGQLVIEILGRPDIDKIKQASPAGERGPWGQWEAEMARKSAVRRLLKKLPAAPIQAIASVLDDSTGQAGAPLAPATAVQDGSRSRPPVLPEDEHALECAALERLQDANGDAELAAAWAHVQADYMQRGLQVPRAVARCHEDRMLEQADEATDEPAGERDPWLDEYDNA